MSVRAIFIYSNSWREQKARWRFTSQQRFKVKNSHVLSTTNSSISVLIQLRCTLKWTIRRFSHHGLIDVPQFLYKPFFFLQHLEYRAKVKFNQKYRFLAVIVLFSYLETCLQFSTCFLRILLFTIEKTKLLFCGEIMIPFKREFNAFTLVWSRV